MSDPVEGETTQSIYEPSRRWATVLSRVLWREVIVGTVLGAALWLVLSELGIPRIFGIGRLAVLPLAMVAGGIIGATRFRSSLIAMTAALLAVVLVVAFTPVMQGPTERLIRRDDVPATADAIVVLSAGVTLDGLLPQQGLDRLLKGVELARAGVATRIVLTRELKRWNGKVITSDADQARLIEFAETTVIATGRTASTREEALRVKELASRGGWTRIVLVTSPFHSRRACQTFEKVGLTVSCVPADSRDVSVNNLTGADDRVRAFSMWTYELAGSLRYWYAGWI